MENTQPQIAQTSQVENDAKYYTFASAQLIRQTQALESINGKLTFLTVLVILSVVGTVVISLFSAIL